MQTFTRMFAGGIRAEAIAEALGCLTKSVRVIDKFQMITSSDKYNLHESDDVLALY